MPQDQPIAHPGAEIVMLGVPRWLVDRLLPGSLGLSRHASRALPFDQQATYTAGWLGQALAQQIDKVEAEQDGRTEPDEHAGHDEHSFPAILFALRWLVADSDPRPTICALEEEAEAGETAEYRCRAQAAAEILAYEWLEPDTSPDQPSPIHRLPSGPCLPTAS
jgi:hypothetical protein